MTPAVRSTLSTMCFVLGFASIIASIAIWFLYKSDDRAHAERFGIFVGLWAPTFLILSDRLLKRVGKAAT
jgi:hypothetical protein